MRPELRRQGSSGSMSQRSFRSPSPASRNAVPPVPALPQDVPPLPIKSGKRPSSQEPPQQVSPASPSHGTRASTMDNSMWATPNRVSVPQSPTLIKTSDLVNGAQATRQGSPSNSPINFSRPMSPPAAPSSPERANAPKPKPRPASTLGLTPEQYKKLRQRGLDPAAQPTDPSKPKSNEGKKYDSKTGPYQSDIDKPALRAGTLADSKHSPVSLQSTSNAPQRPQAMMDKNKRLIVDTKIPSQIPTSDEPILVPVDRVRSPPAQRGPSQDQIKAFQTRAAAMLARPLTDTPNPVLKTQPRQRTASAEVNTRSTTDRLSVAGPSGAEKSHNRAVSQPSADLIGRTFSPGRAQSSSPSRSPHFLDKPVLEGVMHQPPPRSISPVKSAMKSPSPRHASPATSQPRDQGDLSDSRSLVSDEGSVPASKKKKRVRVSFDATPVTVGTAVEDPDKSSDTILSPQYKKSLREASMMEDTDDKIAPRPVLPSFGSVRKRKEADTSVPGSLLGMSQEFMTQNTTPQYSQETSGDGDVPEIVQPRNTTTEQDMSRPIESEAVNDSLAPSIAVLPATPRLEQEDQLASQSPEEDHKKAATNLEDAVTADGVENVADSHPKPAVDDAPHDLMAPKEVSDEPSETESEGSEVFSDAAEDQSEMDDDGGFASLDAIVESPAAESTAPRFPTLPAQMEVETPLEYPSASAPAFTSDRAEPTSHDEQDWDLVRAYWSSLSDTRKQEIEQEARIEEGQDTKKQEIESDMRPEVAPKTAPKTVPKATSKATSKPDVQPSPPKKLSRDPKFKPSVPIGQANQQPMKPLKSSMRKTDAQPDPVKPDRTTSEPIHMRKSMRSPATMQRASMQGPPKAAVGTKQAIRPASMDASPAAVAMARQAVQPVYKSKQAGEKVRQQRRGSDADSESDSSFRKKRGASPANTDSSRYSLKRSMRGASPPLMPTKPPVSSQSDSARKPMRTSVRGSKDLDRKSEKQPSGLFGFGKGSKQQKPSASKSGGGGASSKFRSRFADSSDEDEEKHAFRSRFDSDSSDGEAPPPIKLTPVRGIPRKAGQDEGESTDLPESDADEVPAPKPTRGRPGTPPTHNLLSSLASQAPKADESVGKPSAESPKANGVAQGSTLASGTLRSSEAGDSTTKEKGSGGKGASRRSMFGFGKSKQNANDLSASKWASPSSPNSPPTQSTAGTSRPTTPTRMAKTMREPKGASSPHRPSRFSMRRLSSSSFATSQPGSPKGEQFPFPPPPIPEQYLNDYTNNDRPSTSDGLEVKQGRPQLGQKQDSSFTAPAGRTTSTAEGSEATNPKAKKERTMRPQVYSEKTGRKKKFQGLRRAFGLYD